MRDNDTNLLEPFAPAASSANIRLGFLPTTPDSLLLRHSGLLLYKSFCLTVATAAVRTGEGEKGIRVSVATATSLRSTMADRISNADSRRNLTVASPTPPPIHKVYWVDMGTQGKKVTTKGPKKGSSALAVSHQKASSDFLPFEVDPGSKSVTKGEGSGSASATVLYIGHIPHGFYEDEMRGFFSQFGTVKRLRMARSKKSGKSKHYGFLEFESPEVAKIVADEINNYKVREHLLQVQLIPVERVHPKLWVGANRKLFVKNWRSIQRKLHNKERTIEEHNKLVKRILENDKKRREKLKAAGIEYECPEFVGNLPPAPKKIKFDDD